MRARTVGESKRVIFIPDGGAPVAGTLVETGPLGIWGGGNEPFPTPPIVIPPGGGGEPPDLGIWPNPPEGIAPLPEHPIVIPPPPDQVPPDQPKPPGCDWKYTEQGWILVCGPYEGGKPRPPGKKG